VEEHTGEPHDDGDDVQDLEPVLEPHVDGVDEPYQRQDDAGDVGQGVESLRDHGRESHHRIAPFQAPKPARHLPPQRLHAENLSP
jgi:hypothetical protein